MDSKKKKRKDRYLNIDIGIESTPTSGSTTTDANTIEAVHGHDSELLDLIRDKYCPICQKYVSWYYHNCPDCNRKLE